MVKFYSSVLLALLCSAIVSSANSAELETCESIKNARQRLKCYDIKAITEKSTTDEDFNEIVESPLKHRLDKEEKLSNVGDFVIVPHRPTYFMPVTYVDDINTDPWLSSGAANEDIDNWEAKYQISFKVPLWRDIANRNISLWFGYTQLSLWQLYNAKASSPFRETNYEPEVVLAMETDNKIFGMNNTYILFGLNHQSNGQTKPLSRSWNRLYTSFVLEKNNLVMYFKPWYRLPESAKNDDNPDIEKFLGYGELALFHKTSKRITGLRLWNSLRSTDNHTSVQLDWNFPIGSGIKGYIQYFNGYGETLIDYNYRSKRIGFGIMLTDWF